MNSTSFAEKPISMSDFLWDLIDGPVTPNGESDSARDDFRKECAEINQSLSLQRKSEQVERLRELEEGWDGRDAEPPSDDLLRAAETVWFEVADRFPSDFQRPLVRMSRNGYVTFTWMNRSGDKELHIYIHEGEQERVRHEAHLRAPSLPPFDSKDASFSELRWCVREFYAA
jgi:hypothetical protein